MADERPWLLLDFDGVLNIEAGGMTSAGARTMHGLGWRMGTAFLDCGPEVVCCNRNAGAWLTGLARETGARLAWATMRELVANSRCSPLCGLPSLPVVPVLSAAYKAESVVPWTRGVPFAWFEDMDYECDEADYLAGSQPHLMVQVDPREGLGEEHIEAARQWLASLGREDREHAAAG